ncbi:conserved Plasmodium protein, unknown function [Plasmodium gallinaceum]|uniref:Fam-a protein n=1 Tax=Plasmodium gallinaceum TaxID=5849 RepID=A0A1J1GPN7_PLAGA|nr:conserved Plasmodium protein, unknown function [Plasmodium gallinaceum]CRG93255.1 conserved Plasmodium protein, unknown function [Plasmodium gallinaceum]
MIRLILLLTILCELILWNFKKINSFRLNANHSNKITKDCNVIYDATKRKKFIFKKYEIKRNFKDKLYLSHFNETNNNKREITEDHIEEQLKNVVKDIQGVWKFYLPIYIMDTEFEKPKDEELDKNYKLDNSDDFQINDDTNEENSDDNNLNILRGERLHPLPLFVYNYEQIYSASNSTYACWSNHYISKNIYECTIKIVNKMNNKYMIILQGYLFISQINAIKDNNIRLRPCQIFGNIFLAHNDTVEEKSIIPSNVKIYDKSGNEVKDIISILEKKIPEFRKDKKKIEAFLGLKKWKFLGISTAYKILGEGKNIFNINHILTGKDENTFYNVMDFDSINNNYEKNCFIYLKDIFNSYFEKPSSDIFSLIMKNMQEKSINGPF